MHLMKASEYGIHGVLYLAMQPEGKVTILDEVAEAQKIPKSYLSKIFQVYTKAGILKSYRGAVKGFALAKPPEEINLKELIENFEGKLFAGRCLLRREDCPRKVKCPISLKWREAVAAMNKVLERTTLSDLIEDPDNLMGFVKEEESDEVLSIL